ncbi:MAG: WecB/TagA/CpsF family glycosyltransferase [Pseudomonadota bacterium]
MPAYSSPLAHQDPQVALEAGTSVRSSSPVHFAFPSSGRHVRVLGLDVTDTTLEGAGHWIIKQAQDKTSTNIGFINAHFVNLVHEQPDLSETTKQFDCFYADGIGVKIAARAEGVALTENVNGTDLFPILCKQAAAGNVGLFLLGGETGIATAAAANMKTKTPGLTVSGTASGHFADGQDEQRTIEQINASGADILLVGMGMPIQEQWIIRNRHRLAPSVIIAVGGLFDFYSGRIQRAPKVLRDNGLEWAWRLAMEPRRLFNRYVIGNVKFLARVAAHRISHATSAHQTQSVSQ